MQRFPGKIANRLVSDDMFSEKVAQTLERSIPQRLQTEGLWRSIAMLWVVHNPKISG
jgi:hypothetical protein